MSAQARSDKFQEGKVSMVPLHCQSRFLEHIALKYTDIVNEHHLKLAIMTKIMHFDELTGNTSYM